MIGRAEVFKLAQRFGVGERIIEKDYVLSWVLMAIADSELREHLVFKGGTALKKVYFFDEYRFSEDLDFTLPGDLPHNELVGFLRQLLPSLLDRVNLLVELVHAEPTAHGSTDAEVSYVGPLQVTARPRKLKMDFTRGEVLVDASNSGELKAPYSDYPKGVKLPTYTINEILAEKLCALADPRRTEPRDLFDAWWLMEDPASYPMVIADGFVRKAAHKKVEAARLDEILGSKASRLESLWDRRLGQQFRGLPHFEEVMRAVRRHVRQLELG